MGLLFGGLEHFFFLKKSGIGNFMIPTDELIFFRGVKTTNQKNNNLDFIQFLCRS